MLLTRQNGKPREGYIRIQRETLRTVSLAALDGRLRPGDVPLLLLLAAGADWECGRVRTTIREAASVLKASPTRVMASIHRLERLGLVRRPGKRRGRYATLCVSPDVAEAPLPFFREQHWRYWSRLVDHGESEPPPEPSPALVAARLAKPLEAPAA